MSFRKPGTKFIGAKILVYGLTGSGKSLFGLSCEDILAIDSENGLTDYESSHRGKNLIGIKNTQSFVELEETIDEIYDTYEELGAKTLVIDSETKIYNNIEQAVMTVEEKRARRDGREVDDTNLSMRSYGRIRYVGTKLQNLKIDLTSKGVNVVSVAQAKEVKKKVGDEYVVTGYTPVMNKDAKYDYDIILFFYREEDMINGGYKYFAKVEKDRTETIPAGTIIEGGVSYDTWKDYYEKQRSGKKEALGSSFAKDTEESIAGYDKTSSLEQKSLKGQVTEVIKSLDAEATKTFKAEFAAIKVTDFEKMTVKQQEKLEALIKKYQ